jgi:uncharacterized coiled-coil protein SlyX
MTSDNINHIEETLAYQEQQIQDLSEMVIRQGAEIEALNKKVLRLQDKLSEREDSSQNDKGLSAIEKAALDKPPHY